MKKPQRTTRHSRSDKPYQGKSRSDNPYQGKPRFDKPREKTEFSKGSDKKFHPTEARSDKPRFDKKFSGKGKGEFSTDPSKKFRRDARGTTPRFEKKFVGKPRSEDRKDTPPLMPRERDSVLIWGLHAVRAAWLNPKRRCFRLWMTESNAATFEPILAEARDTLLLKRPDPKRVERHELDRLTPPASVHQGLVLEVAALPEPQLHDIIAGDTPPDLLIMLDQVTDPHNVGAILRSAAAFGAGAIIMTERNAPTTTGVLAKSASGALEHVPQIHVVNLARALDELHDAGYWSAGLAEEGSKDLGELDLTGRTVIVLGAEGEGLRQLTRKKCNELARLPTGGPVSSLNVSNAAAIALYEVRRQKKS